VVTFIAACCVHTSFKFFFDPVIKRVPPQDCVFEKEMVPDIRAEHASTTAVRMRTEVKKSDEQPDRKQKQHGDNERDDEMRKPLVLQQRSFRSCRPMSASRPSPSDKRFSAYASCAVQYFFMLIP
jgi:hypothetical protein